MPNHVTNELIFRGLSRWQIDTIRSKILNHESHVDFELLVPLPINIWCGSVGAKHEKAFRQNCLDWAKQNWGTKWNAYEQREVLATDNSLTVCFDTAWSPPYPWLAAVFNYFKISFEHNWLDEGAELGVHGEFDYPAMEICSQDPWREIKASDEIQKRLHVLKYGEEQIAEEISESFERQR